MNSKGNETAGVERLTLTVEETAHLLGVSRGLAYEMVRSGRLPVIHLGRRLLVPKHGLQEILRGTGGVDGTKG